MIADRRSRPSASRRSSLRPRVGLVLTGAGAHAAYEAGVIRYLREQLVYRTGFHVPFDIITGTSAGAINAALAAATSGEPSRQSLTLCDWWRSLRLDDVLSFGLRDLLRAGRLIFGRHPTEAPVDASGRGGLVDTSGLERCVLRTVGWGDVHRNIRIGSVRALAVSTTHVGTGHTMVFVESGDPLPANWSTDPHTRHTGASIGPQHVLASASIPLFFPAVKIGRDFFTDGGLRLRAPMSPAIRLGADRLLVVSRRHSRSRAEEIAYTKEHERAYSKPVFLLGKALNAIVLDRTTDDLLRMEQINAIMEAGVRRFGPVFTEVLNEELARLRGAPVRRLQAVHIQPSRDVGEVAWDVVASGMTAARSRIVRSAIDRVRRAESRGESALLSYFLFDGSYASELMDLGYYDAARCANSLVDLFAGCASAEEMQT